MEDVVRLQHFANFPGFSFLKLKATAKVVFILLKAIEIFDKTYIRAFNV